MAKIMLVDDEAEIVNLLTVILEMHGFTVSGFIDARAALTAAPQIEPDLLLIDLMMPEMDGLTFVGLCDRLPAVAGVPVVLLTGLLPAEAELSQLRACPGIALLEKPSDPDQIIGEIRRLLAETAAIPDYRRRLCEARRQRVAAPLPPQAA